MSASPLVEAPMAELRKRISRTERRVWISSPFIARKTGSYVADLIAVRSRSQALDVRLLTSYVPDAVSAGYCSPHALLRFHEAGAKLCSLTDLHAKVYVVDDWVLVGSTNLTDGGLDAGNLELAVVLNRAAALHAIRWFERHWSHADHPAGRLTRADLVRKLARDPPMPKPRAGSIKGVPSLRANRDIEYGRSRRRDEQRKAIDELRRALLSARPEGPERGRSNMPSPASNGYRLCRRLRDPDPALVGEVRTVLLDVLERHPSPDARAHAAFRLAHLAPANRIVRKALGDAGKRDQTRLVRKRARNALATANRLS